MQLSRSDDRESIADRFGTGVTRGRLRTGSARRSRLNRLARINSGRYGTSLTIDPDHETAHVDMNGDEMEIVVTGREIPQPITDYPPETWDWIVQKCFTIHEVGHIKYTDHDDMVRRLDAVPSEYTGFAKQAWNALEDGAIEAQIRDRWPNYSVPLLHLRANLFDASEPGIPDVERGGQSYPIAHAVQTGLLDLATYDSGRYRALLDPDDDAHRFGTPDDRDLFVDQIDPLIREVVPDVLGEADAVRRNDRIFDFIHMVTDLLPDADADGTAQMNNTGGGGRGGDSAGMPDETEGTGSGGSAAPADGLGEETGEAAADRAASIDADADEDTPDTPVDPSGRTDADSESLDGSDGGAGDTPDADGDDDSGAAGGAGDPLATDDEIADEFGEAVAEQRQVESGGSQAMMDELESIASALAAGGDGLQTDRVEVPETADGDRGRFETYQQRSQRFEQLLRQRLQQERKTRTKRGTRRGRIDSTQLHRVRQGETRVKMRRNSPDEKDYAFAVLVDRSGSMSGGAIREAEETVATVGCALEAVGADVMVTDLLRSEVSIAKPFGVSFDQRYDHVTTDTAGGGTPLTDALSVVRRRLNEYSTDAKKAVLVITDGQPSDHASYADELDACTFPVIGVQLTDGTGAGEDYYHRYVTAEPGAGELQQMIQELVQEAMDL